MADVDDDFLEKQLQALRKATAGTLLCAAEVFKHARREEYDAMIRGFNAGLVEIGLTVHLTPQLSAECWARGIDGVPQVFATFNARAISGAGPKLQ